MFNRPSIQLGALKAYIRKIAPDVKVFCHHFFLPLAEAVGYEIYQEICKQTWLSESVYAALLYPDRFGRIETFFKQQSRKNGNLKDLDFCDLTQKVRVATDSFISTTDWRCLDMAGFSICLCQLTSSLYLIRNIRRIAPDLALVAGGSIIGGQTALGLLKAFSEIDLIVTGEGELPLARIVNHLKDKKNISDMPLTPGIVRRQDRPDDCLESFLQISDIKTLPCPDFSEYFGLLKGFSGEKNFFPTLPLEMSRGCWWRSSGAVKQAGGKAGGCAFCNLNLQWQGYRSKTPDQMIGEIDFLTSRHKLLSLAFMDNVLPGKTSRTVFTCLAQKSRDFYCFAELRATTPAKSLEVYRRGGVSEVQIGIESLSTRLLKKLNKGTTAIDNLEIMKNCEELGIKNRANLILHFPGSDEEDVAQTLYVLKFARFFQPLRIVYFWLGMQSPVWADPKKYGLISIHNHPGYRHLFPSEICRKVSFMICDYRGDKKKQNKLWRPVISAVRKWKKQYQQLHSDSFFTPALTCHDGGDFLILRERRAGRETVSHRLEGSSREIYLFCRQQRSFKQISKRFPVFSADKLQSFLDMITKKELMYAENGRYLSLAVFPPGL
jgi:ribosomal peptide maturation radical SAM protein 1